MLNKKMMSLLVAGMVSLSVVGCESTVEEPQAEVKEPVKVEEKVVEEVKEPTLEEQVKKAKLPKSFDVEVNEEDKIVTVITHEKLSGSIKGDKHLHLVLYDIGTIGDKLKDVDYTKLQYINETEEGITTFKGLIAKEDIKDVFQHGTSPERTAACTSKIENLSIHQLVLNTMSPEIREAIFF
jgi:hypothetical protein